jgi:NAD(P)-dependent dehydrogenase (short-subunit alcohol dehydrogenase family)
VQFTPARAIVTGSDSGIGKAAAVELAQGGLDVGITWHTDEQGAADTAAEVRTHGRRAEVRRLHLERPDEVAAVIAELAEALGGIDVFVNNAGVGHSAPFLEHRLDDFRRVLDVNLLGAFAAAREAAQRMVDQGSGGRIVNVTSVHEHVPLRGSAAYCASKGGLGLLTKVMALELARHGITVNAIAPGEIATPMTGAEDVDPDRLERPAIPLARPGDAREIAAAIAWLASPGASYTTGASFVIDGGMLLMAAAANQDAKE